MKLNRHQPQLLRLPLKSDLLPAFSRLSGHRNTSLLIARIDHATVVVHRFAQAMPPTTVQSIFHANTRHLPGCHVLTNSRLREEQGKRI